MTEPTAPCALGRDAGDDTIPELHRILIAAALAVALEGRPHRILRIHAPAHRAPLWRLAADRLTDGPS